MSGVLYVVATPIGNLGDITLRGVETLRTAERIVAEDTRHSRKLLSHFGIGHKPIDSIHAHSTEQDVERVLEHLRKGASVALVTDAGTPLVSDPGETVVRAAIDAGIRVVPLPGPSAVVAALSASGLLAGGFRFFGFLSRDGSKQRLSIERICDTPECVVLFESPERTASTLRALADATPERAACVCRELTKLHEEFVRGPLRRLADQQEAWRGEIVIVLGPWEPETREASITDAMLDARIDEELRGGAHSKSIAERLAAWSGRPKRHVYERVLSRKHQATER